MSERYKERKHILQETFLFKNSAHSIGLFTQPSLTHPSPTFFLFFFFLFLSSRFRQLGFRFRTSPPSSSSSSSSSTTTTTSKNAFQSLAYRRTDSDDLNTRAIQIRNSLNLLSPFFLFIYLFIVIELYFAFSELFSCNDEDCWHPGT